MDFQVHPKAVIGLHYRLLSVATRRLVGIQCILLTVLSNTLKQNLWLGALVNDYVIFVRVCTTK